MTYTANGSDLEEHVLANLVIGVDGPNSTIRKLILDGDGPRRNYAGYVAWRGTVPEDQVKPAAREVFQGNITYSMLDGRGSHVVLRVS